MTHKKKIKYILIHENKNSSGILNYFSVSTLYINKPCKNEITFENYLRNIDHITEVLECVALKNCKK